MDGDGPEGFQEDQIYLRTAVSVDHEGWAHFDYVKMPDYRCDRGGGHQVSPDPAEPAIHRNGGIYAGLHFDVEGNPIGKDERERRKREWLPSAADEVFVKSLMNKPIYDPKQMANWIAAPPRGIKGRPVDFEYVKHSE